MILLIFILLLAMLYLWCIKGRRHPDLHKLCGHVYAHRGFHSAERPENSLSAFQAAVDRGYGSELDIHLMKDGNLAVIHDASLQRTVGADVMIEDLTTQELENFRLQDSQEPIPLFSQVLELYAGQAPLIVELKCERNNYAALCKAACQMLDGYDGLYCLESFDPRCIRWLRKHRPELIRGQLSENWMKTNLKLPWILRFVMTYHLGNFFTRPDFIAYRFTHRRTFGTGICRKLWRLQGVSWTLKTKEEFDTAVSEDWIPIFEGFEV